MGGSQEPVPEANEPLFGGGVLRTMRFDSWWPYALANVVLIAALVVLAPAWPEFKRRALALVRSRVLVTETVPHPVSWTRAGDVMVWPRADR